MQKLLVKTHEVWLVTLMASFMSNNAESKRVLNDFSDILFRNLTWIERDLIKRGEDYDYNRGNLPIKVDSLKVILSNISTRLTDMELMLSSVDNEELRIRLESDWDYMKFRVNILNDEKVTAFDMNRTYKNYSLSKEAVDAFTLFLFDESYKEYELIMIYNYLKAHFDDDFLNKIFQILVDESMFHLKSFGNMMAEMGILAVPRTLHKSLYQIEDVVQFLKDGIEEETAAKEMCRDLSAAVGRDTEELARFFDFINNQESYHIELMKEALAYYEKKELDG